MLGDVLVSLKNTRKGNLKYDRSWVFEGRAKDILQDVSLLSCIHYAPTEASQPLDQEKEGTKAELIEQSTVILDATPIRKQDVILDNCSKILDYEQNRKKNVHDTVSNFVCELDTFGEQRNRHIEQQMSLLHHSWKLEEQRRNDQMAQLQVQELLEAKEQQSKLKEHQKTHAKRLKEKMREVEERLRQEQEQKEQELKKKQIQQERYYQIRSIQSQVAKMLPSFAEALGACTRPDLMQQEPRAHLQVVLNAQNALQRLVDSANEKELTLEDAQHAQVHFLSTKAGLSCLQSDIAQANSKLRDSEQKINSKLRDLEQEAEAQANQETKSQPNKNSEDVQLAINVKSEPTMPNSLKEETKRDLGILTGSVDPNSYAIYEQLLKAMTSWEESFKPLEMDPNTKKMQFEMKKAVNTPVNAISSQSGQQLRDKLDRLICLLLGGTISGNVGKSGFSCQQHSLGLHFCTHLLAKKIISQAESQVSSHQEAAFPLAAVAVGLWARFPKFGELLLAQLYTRCPYLLPIYHQQKKGQSEKDFHILLGYKYENGEMEAQDQFLKRMGGIVCFYAALLQTNPPPRYAKSHPHGIQHGWQYLTQLVNLRPRFDITATVIYHFLEVAGAALYGTYRKQMHKLICYLHKDYIQQIHKVTGGESGGPVARLESFLADTAKSGRIASPSGILTAGFWNT